MSHYRWVLLIALAYLCGRVLDSNPHAIAGELFEVQSPREIQAALTVAKVGDIIRVKAGHYREPWGAIEIKTDGLTIEGQSKALYPSDPNAKTAFAAPISFILKASRVTIRNFHFLTGVGRSAIIVTGTRAKIARFNRLYRLYFLGTGDSKCEWNPSLAPQICHASIFKFGEFSHSNTLSKSVFKETKDNASVFNAVSPSTDGHAQDNRVTQCHFLDTKKPSTGARNGLDAIMIGTAASGSVSNHAHKYTRMQIDHNIFQRVEGESEIVSSKTYGNEIAFNLFLESQVGHLRLRAGGDSKVIGNVFRNTNGGVVINGIGHQIRANLIMSHGTPSAAVPSHRGGLGGIHFSQGSDLSTQSSGFELVSFISSRQSQVSHNIVVSGHPLVWPSPKSHAIVSAPELQCGKDPHGTPIACDRVPFENTFNKNLIHHFLNPINHPWSFVFSEQFWKLNPWSGDNAFYEELGGGSLAPLPLLELEDHVMFPQQSPSECVQITAPVSGINGGMEAPSALSVFSLVPCQTDEMSSKPDLGRVGITYPAVLPGIPGVR